MGPDHGTRMEIDEARLAMPKKARNNSDGQGVAFLLALVA